MSSQITCAYSATAVGSLTGLALQSAMAAIALDSDLLNAYGLRVTLDQTSAASSPLIVRTIVLAMGPSVAATATTTLFPGDGSGSPIDAVVMGTAGLDYIAPPVVTVPPANVRGGLLHANLGVLSTTVAAGGALYPSGTVVKFVGGQLAPGGVVPTATPTVLAGVVTGVTMLTPGGPYATPPTAILAGAGGSGGVLVVHLGLTGIAIDDPGLGYTSPPPVTITPLFKSLFPDGTDQVSPLAGWMTEIFQSGLKGPVVASVPVVA